MSYKVVLIPEAEKDYKRLDGSIKKLVNKKIEELSKKPFIGDRLGNKFNIDLTGFFKIYVAKKSYRIVYRLSTPAQIEIIEIRGIGMRHRYWIQIDSRDWIFSTGKYNLKSISSDKYKSYQLIKVDKNCFFVENKEYYRNRRIC